MEENKYILPKDNSRDMVSDSPSTMSQLSKLQEQLMERVMNIQNAETLQSLIVYVDNNILQKDNSFEEEWNHAISLEEFRTRCKSRLKAMYGV